MIKLNIKEVETLRREEVLKKKIPKLCFPPQGSMADFQCLLQGPFSAYSVSSSVINHCQFEKVQYLGSFI